MRFSRYRFDRSLSQDRVDEIINNLIVNLSVFDDIACMDGMTYGVHTLCSNCSVDFTACLRSQLLQQLAAAQFLAEGEVGYEVTPRYQVYEERWAGSKIIQVRPGILAVNVARAYGDPTSYDISPYIELDVPITSGDGFCIATLDQELVENPLRVMLRDENGGGVPTVEQNGYPKRDVDGNWQVVLKNVSNCADEEAVYNVQHCNYMIVDVPDEDMVCEEGEEYLPFYPNSNQFIPMAKDPEQKVGFVRYWFNVYTLLDEAFAEEGADLARGQFSRLMRTVDFRCVSEAEDLPSFNWLQRDENCAYEYVADTAIAVKILDAKLGTLLIDPAAFRCSACANSEPACTCTPKVPLNIRIAYKTDPTVLGYEPDLEAIRMAIAYKAAAELPLKTCNCTPDKMKDTFVGEAKSPTHKVRQTGAGVITESTNIGKLYGQYKFRENISDVKKIYEQILL